MSYDDDQQIGRVLSRREALALIGAVGAVLLPACASNGSSSSSATTASAAAGSGAAGTTGTTLATATTRAATATTLATVAAPSCIVRPTLTEGPYFVDEKLNRTDIRPDPSTGAAKSGVPLVLTFRLARLSGGNCTALSGATVDVWHCDAGGLYSDVSANGTVGQKFLRGYQMSDANGLATFTTIFPGWYQGRAVHIHFKVRSGSSAFTSQLFFDPALTTQVFSQTPYSGRGTPDTPNSRDGIYQQSGGQLLLDLTPAGQGYSTSFDLGLQL